MGNDIVSWRAAVGLFYSKTRGVPIKYYFYPLKYFINISFLLRIAVTRITNSCANVLTSSILNIHCGILVALLVIMSGDVELNPGPISKSTTNTNDSLSILHLNIRGIRNKLNYIMAELLDFDVLCFTETHLDATVPDSDLLIDGFSSIYRKDRSCHSGGLLMYVSQILWSKRRDDLETTSVHSMWVELRLYNISLLLCNCYRSPNTPVHFWNDLNINIERAIDCTENITIVGDLNEDLLNTSNRHLHNVMLLNNLNNTITGATRVTNNSATLIDPILISDALTYNSSGTIDVENAVSDHKATFIHINILNRISTTCSKRKVWLYARGNFEQLNELINLEDWSFISSTSVEESCNRFSNKILELMHRCIPSKDVTIRPDDKPWYDSTIRKYSRLRDRQKKIASSRNNPIQWTKYERIINFEIKYLT